MRARVLPSQRTKNPLERLRLLVRLAVLRVTRSNDYEFEDIVQTSLASVLAALGPRCVEAELSGPWVVCVARNVAIDCMRARARARRVFFGGDATLVEVSGGSALQPDHLTDVRDELRRVDDGLRRIDRAQSMVVYLHDVRGHGLAEIAAGLGVSAAAAQSRLVRGRRALERERRSPTGRSSRLRH